MAKIFINSNIEFLRKKKSWSQERFAEWLGVNRSTLSSWEEYRASPKLQTLAEISTKLELSIDDMLLKDLRK